MGSVTRVAVDRDGEDEEGTFGARIAALRPDVVLHPGHISGPGWPVITLTWLAAHGQADVGGQEF